MGMEVALLLRRYPYHILVILYRGPIGMTPPRMRVGSHLNSALRPHFSCRLFADDSWITFAWLFVDAFEEARGGRVSPGNLLVFFFWHSFFVILSCHISHVFLKLFLQISFPLLSAGCGWLG